MRNGAKILSILVMILLLQSTIITCLAEEQPPPKIPVRVKKSTVSGDVGFRIYPDGWIKIFGHISTFSEPAKKPAATFPTTLPMNVNMSRSRRTGF